MTTVGARGELYPLGWSRGLDPSVYEWNRERRGSASDENEHAPLRREDPLQLAAGSFTIPNAGRCCGRRRRGMEQAEG
jgi:hypothetical protein